MENIEKKNLIILDNIQKIFEKYWENSGQIVGKYWITTKKNGKIVGKYWI